MTEEPNLLNKICICKIWPWTAILGRSKGHKIKFLIAEDKIGNIWYV